MGCAQSVIIGEGEAEERGCFWGWVGVEQCIVSSSSVGQDKMREKRLEDKLYSLPCVLALSEAHPRDNNTLIQSLYSKQRNFKKI